MNPRRNTKETFIERIKKTDTCWIWQGKISRGGYGYFCMNNRAMTAHRYAYELFRGKIPDGLCIDHLCRNRACVNPDHLEAVTDKVNILRGISGPSMNAKKEYCKRGHPFSGSNVLYDKQGRRCRKCACILQKNWVIRNPEKKLEKNRSRYRKVLSSSSDNTKENE